MKKFIVAAALITTMLQLSLQVNKTVGKPIGIAVHTCISIDRKDLASAD